MPVRLISVEPERASNFMKTEVIDISPTRKEIKIEIEADTVRSAYDRISDRYAQQASVPGFRPGHAPRSVVRSRFKDQIRSEVLQEIVPQAVQDAISEHSVNAIGEQNQGFRVAAAGSRWARVSRPRRPETRHRRAGFASG